MEAKVYFTKVITPERVVDIFEKLDPSLTVIMLHSYIFV